MKTKYSNKWLVPLVLGAATLAATNAQAVDGTANADVILPLTLTEDATLEFGQLSSAASIGTVVIDTADGRTQTGGVTLEGGTARSGAWSVAGEASTAYTITLPASTSLTGAGDPMTVNAFSDSQSGSSTTDGSGDDTFKVGATLNVNASQAAGSYTGTYAVTVAYQ